MSFHVQLAGSIADRSTTGLRNGDIVGAHHLVELRIGEWWPSRAPPRRLRPGPVWGGKQWVKERSDLLSQLCRSIWEGRAAQDIEVVANTDLAENPSREPSGGQGGARAWQDSQFSDGEVLGPSDQPIFDLPAFVEANRKGELGAPVSETKGKPWRHPRHRYGANSNRPARDAQRILERETAVF